MKPLASGEYRVERAPGLTVPLFAVIARWRSNDHGE
jgi:hypothetical protein